MIRRIATTTAVALTLMTGTALAAYQLSSQLEQFSQWLLSRIKPELEVMIGSISMRSISQFVVSDLYLRPKDGDGSESVWVERLTLEVEWAPPVSIRVRSLRADQPVLRIGDRLLDILMGKSSAASDGGGAGRAAPLPAVQIRDGNARLRISELPPADFQFSADTDGSGEVRVSLEAFRAGAVALAPDAGPAAPGGMSADSLLAVLPRDLPSTRTVKLVEITAPTIHFTPEGLTAWSGWKKESPAADSAPAGPEDATAAPGSGPAAATASAAPIPVPSAIEGWGLAAVSVRGGRLELSGWPPEMPVVGMDFSADIESLGFAGDARSRPHILRAANLHAATSFAPARPFLVVPDAAITFSVGSLLDRRITSLEVANASLTLDRAFRTMAALREHRQDGKDGAPSAPAFPDSEPSPFWLVERFGFKNTRVSLADLGAGIPDVGFRLPSSTLANVALTGDTRSASESLERVEVADIVLHSPLDPFTPVVTLPSLFVDFSLAGLLRREIDSLHILHPTIHVGRDLFWFIENSRKSAAAAPRSGHVADAAATASAGSPPPSSALPDWSLGEFRISHGRLAIATRGANRLALPIPFQTRATGIKFQNLADLRLDLDIEVPAGDYRFPSYQLELLRLAGSLTFGLPPGSNANNLVNTLTSESVVWRQFRSGTAWVSVTYDVEGIYGKFGAGAYGGYLDGGFSFFLNPESSWTGWAAGAGIDLGQFTAAATPGNLSLDGPADFKVQVNAEGPAIQRVVGSFSTTRPGTLTIPRLEALLERLPTEWSPLKRDIARIGIDSLREFPYESGRADFWFINKHGRLNMALTGPEGSRTFDVVVHDTPFTAPMLWEQSFDFSTSMQLGQQQP